MLFDFVDVACFVGVDFRQDFGDLVCCNVSEFEGWVFDGWSFGHAFFFLAWDVLARFMANGDVAVVEGVGDVDGVCVGFSFVDDECG